MRVPLAVSYLLHQRPVLSCTHQLTIQPIKHMQIVLTLHCLQCKDKKNIVQVQFKCHVFSLSIFNPQVTEPKNCGARKQGGPTAHHFGIQMEMSMLSHFKSRESTTVKGIMVRRDKDPQDHFPASYVLKRENLRKLKSWN